MTKANEGSNRKIKEILIVDNSGMALFYHNFEAKEKMDYQLIAGFLHAIQLFSNLSQKDDLHAIVLGENKYSLFKGDAISIILKTGFEFESISVLNQLERLRNNFLNTYESAIQKNLTDPWIYKGFEETVRIVFDIQEE